MDILLVIIGIAVLIPVGIDLFIGVDTSGWDPTLVSIWDVLPIIAIVVALGLLITAGGIAGKRRGFFAFAPVFLIPGGAHIMAIGLTGFATYKAARKFHDRRLAERDSLIG